MIRIIVLFVLSLAPLLCEAQLRNNPFRTSRQEAEVPFEYINNFIVVEVIFNNFFPLKFILDTGAENTVITQREITDLFQVDYTKRFTVLGADMETELVAYLAQGIDLKLGNQVNLKRQNLLVLEEDYFRFEEYAGIAIQGIIGADILRFFVIKIDYRRKVITFTNPNNFEASPRSYTNIPVSFKRHKPYLRTGVNINPGQSQLGLKLLVDTGASLAMLLHSNTDSSLVVPKEVIPTNIGMGLGGFLNGFVGRAEKVQIGDFELPGVVCYYMDINPNIDSNFLNRRNGVLGNAIWDRFTMIIDYPREKMYLKPNRRFKRKFTYDRSGLVLSASGNNLRKFVVMDVVENSPAAEAGIQVGDILRSFNRLPSTILQLDEVNKRLRAKSGKKVRLSFIRGEERYRVKIKLRDYL